MPRQLREVIEVADGFPEEVESIVRDNAASLRITDFGFEGA